MGNPKNAVKIVALMLIVLAAAYLLWGNGSSGSNTTTLTNAKLNNAKAGQQNTTTVTKLTPPSSGLGPISVEPAVSQSKGLSISTLDSYYSRPCDLGNVSQITVTSPSNPGYGAIYELAGSGVMQIIRTIPGNSPVTYNYTDSSTPSTMVETDLLNLLVCAGSQVQLPTPESFFQLARQYNGSANGDWFAAKLNGSEAYLSMSTAGQGGNATLTLEERQPNSTYNNTLISRTVIINGTRSLSSVTILYIPGQNPMTSVPLAALVGNYSGYVPAQLSGFNATSAQQGQYNPITNFSYKFS